MKASELRIGNWISDQAEEEKIFQIEQIAKDKEGFKGYFVTYRNGSVQTSLEDEEEHEEDKYLQPIPLTEEWLVKFGFEEDLSKLDPPETPNGNFWSEWVKGDVIISMPFYSFIWNYGECEIDLKHVHQLQNLYFSLIGKELEISE